MPGTPSPSIVFLDIDSLRPHEDIRHGKLAQYSRFANRFRRRLKVKPLWVDRKTRVILDGHHRYTMLRDMGCKTVPCILVEYLTDRTIEVFPRKAGIPVSKQSVLEMGISGNTYPPKTTRHEFAYEAPFIWMNVRKAMGDGKAGKAEKKGRAGRSK